MRLVDRVKMDDFRDEDGNIRWSDYRQARVRNGESCQKCHTHLIFAKGHADTCRQCRLAEETDEIWHDRFVRCPKCGYMWDPSDGDDYDLMADGDHDVQCYECDHGFEISTTISFSFKSPERTREKEHASTD